MARTDLVTETVLSKERDLFKLAFELAYFIHAHKEIAFFIAEDALEGLSSLLGYQRKNRAPSERLRGFWKWGERSRPIRKTLILDEYQMLQWLVYKRSESWERQTEEGKGLYVPSEEDLIVRYIQHLIFLTVRRGSFYVTLAVCSLLHHFGRRETRFFYDVLTQSDAARMKDTSYIGKQRLELLDKVLRRFEGMVETAKSGNEKQFLMRPATERTTILVTESLQRFTPWGTTCVIGPGFDVTDIPGLFFSGTTSNEEDLVEMNRIHTVLHPNCLIQFTKGLSEYVRSLPSSDLDKSCSFDTQNERLVLPHFSNFEAGPPRRDRFPPPTLTTEDYIRLQRTLDARGHRKKAFVAQKLSVYVDGISSYSFEPNSGEGRCVIASETSFIEIRGQDSSGEVMLAMLVLGELQPATAFEESIVHSGGQRVRVKLTPFEHSDNNLPVLQLEIAYQQSPAGVFGMVHRASVELKRVSETLDHAFSAGLSTRLVSFGKAGILAMSIAALGLLLWQFQRRPRIQEKPLDKTIMVNPPELEPQEERSPAAGNAPLSTDVKVEVARVRWRTDREAALGAIPIELTRAETPTLDFSGRQTKLTLSLPLYDPQGQPYSRYRLTLIAAENHLWRHTIIAPKISLTGYAHILEIALFNRRLAKNSKYRIHVEGLIQSGWRPIGEVKFSGP